MPEVAGAESPGVETRRLIRARATVANRRRSQLARVEWEANLPEPEPYDWEAWRRNRARLINQLLIDPWTPLPDRDPRPPLE